MKVALTFDDGPTACTSRILNALQLYGGHLSFFVLGSQIEEHKGKIFRAWQMGCEIICHTWDHPHLADLDKKAIKKQLLSTNEAIKAITGKVSPYFRPPYGEYDEKVSKVAKKLGLSMVNWSLSTDDWDHKDGDRTYTAIMRNAQDGDIILCHDSIDSTADAMSRVIPDLINRGVELVTVSELLSERFGKLVPGEIYYDPA